MALPNQRKPSIMKPETPAKPKGLPGAQVAKVLELVNYQDGAVVSREIVKKPTGNVTLFAFDEGQGLSEHTAPFDALAQVLEGAAEITISGQPHQLQGSEMILMPAGQPHALKALTRFKMILTMIRS
jgi:quercetin dioxygenase-like cupin family protein